MGTIRTTLVINEEGFIEQIFQGKQIKTKEHATQILTK
jgi:peroxiredoxin Q/BCP